jgi:hypothetical protein
VCSETGYKRKLKEEFVLRRCKLLAYTHGSISAFEQIYSFLCGYLKRLTFIHTQGVAEEFGDTFRKCERKSGFSFDRMHFGS